MANILWIIQRFSSMLAMGLLLVSALQAQTAGTQSPAIPQTVEDVLHRMSDRADVVFAGEVIAIRPHDAEAGASGFVEIDFRIDQAIRGCSVGGTYALREWAGLWSADSHRYEAGERLLMLLHAPGPSGMSSPVGGMDGAIPIRGGGAGSLFAAASTVSAAPVADLRWLGAKLLHPVSYRLQSELAATPLTMAQQMSSAALSSSDEMIAEPTAADGSASNRPSVPVQQASVNTVVKLLTSWQKAPHDEVR